MKYLLISLLALGLSACAAVPQNPTIHSTNAGLGARVDAVDEGGSPSMTAGLFTSTAQVTPNETRAGLVLTAEWDEVRADGSSITIRDQRSTCSVNTSGVLAEFGFGGGNVIHVTGTGNGAPELCAGVQDWIGGARPAISE